jgi:SpoVK/Ycf46/Vps4 family AAA+-type ATPase
MPNDVWGRWPRTLWRRTLPDGGLLTVPVFMAYCGIAAALRPWARTSEKAILTLDVTGDYCREVHIAAAEAFVSGIWDTKDWEKHVFEWSPKSLPDQMRAEKNQMGVFFSPPRYSLTDDDRLFSDAVIQLPPRTPRHAMAALRHAGLPVDPTTIELLISESWDTLNSAFQSRRHPLRALSLVRHATKAKRLLQPVPQISMPPKLTLDDMHGFDPAVAWGHSLAIDLANYRADVIPWSDVDSGVLISGPPGIGKTMFAGALANTCNVPIVHGSLSRWQEAGALDDHLKAMRSSFKEAQEKAPSILFIDEIDTIGDRSMSDRNAGYMRAVIAALLEHLDGFVRREGVVVVAACNRPELVDKAVLRAGRLDRHIPLDYPDGPSRRAILKHHCGIALNGDLAERFEVGTEGLSGAEVEQVARGARRAARRRSERLGAEHILAQLPVQEVIAPDYFRRIAVHEAGHAVIGTEIGRGKVSGITISKFRTEGRSRELGIVKYAPAQTYARTRGDYLDEIALLLGGIAAELEVFGAFTDGASGSHLADLNRATSIATAVEGGLGLGHTLVVEKLDSEHLSQVRLYNSELRRQVHHLLEAELARSRLVIQRQREALDALVESLMHQFSLSGDEVAEIIRCNRRAVVSLAKP